jgi:hypothetical protein
MKDDPGGLPSVKAPSAAKLPPLSGGPHTPDGNGRSGHPQAHFRASAELPGCFGFRITTTSPVPRSCQWNFRPCLGIVPGQASAHGLCGRFCVLTSREKSSPR